MACLNTKEVVFTYIISLGAVIILCYMVIVQTSTKLLVVSVQGVDSLDRTPSLGKSVVRCAECSTVYVSKDTDYVSHSESINITSAWPRTTPAEQITPESRVLHAKLLPTSATEPLAVQSTLEGDAHHADRTLLQVKLGQSQLRENSTIPGHTLLTTATTTTSKLKCRQPLCAEYLSEGDKSRFTSCLQKVKSYGGTPQAGRCQFMSQTHRAPVALASYPGSGNTWLRGLLEAATGICTGFTFCDISMRVKGFAGENIQSGAVLLVKTHSEPHWNHRTSNSVHFGSAVFLVRNPLDAFVAEWNRRVSNNFQGHTVSLTSHVRSAGQEMFGTNKRWTEFLHSQIPRWQNMIRDWVVAHGNHPVLVVKYEDLKRNTMLQVTRILNFLKFPHIDQEVHRRITVGFNSFHRSHKAEFDHYTPIQRIHILRAVNSTFHLLSKHGLAHVLQIHDYLM